MNSPAEPDPQPSLPPAPKLQKRSKREGTAEAEQKKKTRSWRDYVLWGVLVVLAVAAAAEFRAQAAYNKALATCNAALDRNDEKGSGSGKHLTFDEFKDNLPPDPVYTEGKHAFAKAGIYTWTWQGVRRYKLHLYVDPKTHVIWDVETEPSSNRD